MPHRATRTLLVLFVAFAGLLAAGPPAAAQPDPAGGQVRPQLVDPQLRSVLATAAAGEQVEYLVAVGARPDLAAIRGDRAAVVRVLRETAAASQRPVVAELRARGAQVLNRFWLANLILVRSAAGTVTGLTALPAVARLLPVAELRVPDPGPVAEPAPDQPAPDQVEDRTWGLDRIGAHRVWDELGVDGTGVRVAVLDTGVAHQHPDLAGRLATADPADPAFPGGWMEFDAAGNPVPSQPHDTQNHGTHVSGTVVGGDASGVHIGVAPGAELMHGLVLPGGSGTTPQIVAGMQWAVDPYDRQGNPAGEPADVVNMSFGPQAGGVNDALVEPVRNMYAAGVLPVASAGNCGDGCHGSPANVLEALAVGATGEDDAVAGFSSGGTATPADFSDPPAGWPERWLVPDLSAPGVDVRSSIASGFGTRYGVLSGTSMAAPHVAGTAALMRSGDPDLSLDALTEALVATSFFDDRHGPQRPNSRYGHGRIDAFQAAARVVLDTGVAGRVTDAGTGEPVPGVRVAVAGAGVSLRTAADGRFEFRLPPGSYPLELSWSGRTVSTVPAVVVDAGLTTVDARLPGIAGQVRDAATRTPVPGVTVTVAGTGVAVTTGADGRYRLYLRPERYALELAGFGYQPVAEPELEVVPDRITTLDIALDPLPTGTVTGTVRYVDSGLGVPGVRVELAGGQRSAVTGAGGGYTIAEVPIGSHPVVARPELFREPAAVQVAVAADRAVTVDFDLECGADCAGLWVARHDGPQASGFDSAQAVEVSPDGSRVYLTGGEGTFGDRDFATLAYHSVTGERLWTSRYNGPADHQDSAGSLAVSPDGSRVFVTGTSVGAGTGTDGVDYATVAYDAVTGQELWVARYDGPAGDFDNPNALRVSPDGARVFVTGQSRATGPPAHTEYATVAYHAATGQELWVARYNGPSSDFDGARDLQVSPDGARVFVTGQSPGVGGQSSSQGSGWDYATVAYDAATGDERWVARYDGPAGALDQAAAVTISPDGGRLFVTGASRGEGTGPADYTTVAYRTGSGEQLWVARYDGSAGGIDQAKSVAVSPDGGAVYVTGESWSGGGADTIDYATVAYDAATGEELWVARYDGPGGGTDRARAVVASPDGSQVVVTGGSEGEGTGTDYATVAYRAAGGEQRWVARYDGPAGDADNANAVGFAPDGGRLYVTGRSGLGLGEDPLVAPSDYLTVAYDAAGTGESPVFVAHDLRVATPVVAVSTSSRVTALVTNVGTAPGGYAATLVVDEAAVESRTVTLAPGQTAEVAWTLTRDEPGRYRLRVGAATAILRVVACDQTVAGTRPGPLVVAGGVTCLTERARVLGPVTVRAGAGLLATGAAVTGPVSAAGAGLVALAGARVTGPVTVQGTTGSVALIGSSLTGPVRLTANWPGDGPAVVAGNRVTGPLGCERNLPPPVNHGQPNQVTGPASGQCAGL